jgi:hypothetical protein
MKLILITYLTLCSFNLLAATVHTCLHDGYSIKVTSDKKSDISLMVSKGKTSILICNLKVVSYTDGKSGVSKLELTRFSKIKCDAIYDKIASKIFIIDQGFIKGSGKRNESYAYVIKNEQPLKCSSISL